MEKLRWEGLGERARGAEGRGSSRGPVGVLPLLWRAVTGHYMATGDWCSPSQMDFQGLVIPANTGKKKGLLLLPQKGLGHGC